ncbi:MAG: M23 family metallopeptidase [Thermoanaerobaculia bacterium]
MDRHRGVSVFHAARAKSLRKPALFHLSTLTILAALAVSAASAQPGPAGGGALVPALDHDGAPSPEFVAAVQASRARLLLENRLPLPDSSLTTNFAFPLRRSGVGYFFLNGTSNFVDQQTGSAAILDWNCGNRTYDAHRGTDLFTYPFGWLLMDESKVEVVAAAAGIILEKSDGEVDRSCALGTPDEGNYVALEHPDGSVSAYFHMKMNSVTTKTVGSAVAAGEYLGVVGSSGNSTGPHLHFEVYSDAIFDIAHLVDPWNGTCDSLAGGSQWISPPPYRTPRVNAILTADAQPGFPACPAQEIPHEKRLFNAGDPIHFVPFLTDELVSTPKTLKLIRPDGSVHSEWSHTTNADYSNSWWFWYWGAFPGETPQRGRWVFQVTIDGHAYDRAFWIDTLFADDFENANTSSWSLTAP